MPYFRSIISCLFLFCTVQVSAQRVGLVLSGGGAKGLYHIGVIQALEENGIPIDYISGTSMGAIIGGLYAIGYSPEEMSEIFQSRQVTYWMNGRIEDRYIYYFKKQEPNAAMFNLRLDMSNPRQSRIQLPTNLIPSTQIDMAFVDFFAGATVQSGGNFDNLFVPFRCVATDAAARREVVYREGDIGKAIRASMTIPLVFRPLRQDSTLLYDGGIYNNFPWDVLQEDFAPDILIGSKCVSGNSNPDDENIVEQISTLTMMHTDYELPEPQDILIEHVFNDVSMLDFSQAAYVIGRGYSDAIDAMPTIKERIKRRADSTDLERRRADYRESLPRLVFEKYEIKGLNDNQTDYVKQVLRFDRILKARDSLTFDEFKSEYFKLLSEGEFEGDYPEVAYNPETGLYELELNLRTKPSFKIMVGGNISSTSLNQAYVGLEYKHIGRNDNVYNLDGYISGLYSSIQARGRTEFYYRTPVALEYGFNYNYYNYFRSHFGGLGKRNDLTYTKFNDLYTNVGISFPSSRSSKFGLRFHAGRESFRYYQNSRYTDDDVMDHNWFPFIGAQLESDRNTLNYQLYPTRGIRQTVSAIYVVGKDHYQPGTIPEEGITRETDNKYWFGARFFREHYFSFADWFSFGYMVEGVLTSHPSFSNDYATNITSPAFTPTVHSQSIYLRDFRSNSFVGAGVMPTFEFGPRLYIKSGFYTFLPNDINDVKVNVKKRVRYIFTLAPVYQTPIGPISLSLSKYDATSNSNWFLTFNFGYTIFNRKGLFY